MTDGWGRGMFIAGSVAGQSRGKPKDVAPWPIVCCCGAKISDQAALRIHTCAYLPAPRQEEP
jgi:hypothetical protein